MKEIMENHVKNPEKSRKRIMAALLAAFLVTGSIALTACGEQTEEQEGSAVTGALEKALTSEGATLLSEEFQTAALESAGTIKTYFDYTASDYQTVQLNGSSMDFQGTGAKVSGSDLTITSPGTYVISGTLDDGCIVVDSAQEENVILVLNNASISCSDGAPIYVKNCGKNVILSLPEGTNSTVVDGKSYTYEYMTEDEPSAAIFSNDDLRINGTGTLIVKGSYSDGIKCDDDLQITEASITVTAVDDGIVGKDSVQIGGGEITVDAGGDGIKATNDQDSEKAYIAIAGGNFNLTTVNDGIQAESALLVSAGDFNIETSGSTVASDSSKALKATGDLVITGGTFDINSTDDGLHSNSNVLVKGGTLNISAGDDGIHADSALGIGGGATSITKSYEGIESALIVVLDGTVEINSSDDGVNVAGGNNETAITDTASTESEADTASSTDANTSATAVAGGGNANGMDPRMQDQFDANSGRKLIISGGTMTVNADGDGIDVNGSAYMSDGTVTVTGPTSDGDGALDYSGVFEVTGGTLLAAGSSGMAQAPSDGTSQYTIAAAFDAKDANTTVRLEDENGNTVLSFSPLKSYEYVVISSPLLEKGATYTLKADGAEVAALTLDSIVTTSGNVGNGMMPGGGGGHGGPGTQGLPDGQTRPVPPDGATVTGSESGN